MREYSFKISGKGYTRWGIQHDGWIEAERITPRGCVSIYVQESPDYTNHTRMDFIHGGRVYVRNWERVFSRRKVAQLANEFVRDVVGD